MTGEDGGNDGGGRRRLDSRLRGNDGGGRGNDAPSRHPPRRPATLVTPAKAGVQTYVTGQRLDSRLRGNDGEAAGMTGRTRE